MQWVNAVLIYVGLIALASWGTRWMFRPRRRCVVCGLRVPRWAHRPLVFWRDGWRFAHRECGGSPVVWAEELLRQR
jgi:hypothetical protein